MKSVALRHLECDKFSIQRTGSKETNTAASSDAEETFGECTSKAKKEFRSLRFWDTFHTRSLSQTVARRSWVIAIKPEALCTAVFLVLDQIC